MHIYTSAFFLQLWCVVVLGLGLSCSELRAASLFHASERPAVPLLQASAPADGSVGNLAGGSLFAGRQGGGLFAPVARRLPKDTQREKSTPRFDEPLQLPAIIALRSLIASVEAGPAQYDAVVYSAKIKPPKPPTHMRVSEIYAWIDATPGQNHAIGRYQFIPATLRKVMKEVGVSPEAQFTPALQDRLADVLLHDAGLASFLGAQLSHQDFMNNLARIWAGLPNSTGKSHYAGIAGNKAGMSWGKFKREMSRIFPASLPVNS